MSHKYSQILLDHTRQSATNAHKTVPKREEFRKQHKQLVIQLVIKSLKKVTITSKTLQKDNSETLTNEHQKEIPKERYISPREN